MMTVFCWGLRVDLGNLNQVYRKALLYAVWYLGKCCRVDNLSNRLFIFKFFSCSADRVDHDLRLRLPRGYEGRQRDQVAGRPGRDGHQVHARLRRTWQPRERPAGSPPGGPAAGRPLRQPRGPPQQLRGRLHRAPAAALRPPADHHGQHLPRQPDERESCCCSRQDHEETLKKKKKKKKKPRSQTQNRLK